MTYEEAIDAIKSNYPQEHYTMLREALDMAIEALALQSLYEFDESEYKELPYDMNDEVVQKVTDLLLEGVRDMMNKNSEELFDMYVKVYDRI